MRSSFQRSEDKRAAYESAKAHEKKERNNYLVAFGVALEHAILYSGLGDDLFPYLESEKEKLDESMKARIEKGIAIIQERVEMGRRIYLEISEDDAQKAKSEGKKIIFDENKGQWFTYQGNEAQFIQWMPANKRIYLVVDDVEKFRKHLEGLGAFYDSKRKRFYTFESQKEKFSNFLTAPTWTAWTDIKLKTPEDDTAKNKLSKVEGVVVLEDGRYAMKKGGNLLLVKKYLPIDLLDFLKGNIYTEKTEAIAGMKISSFTINKKRGKICIKKGTDVSQILAYLPPLIKSLFETDRDTWNKMWGIKEPPQSGPRQAGM